MKKYSWFFCLLFSAAAHASDAHKHMDDDPLVGKVTVHQLERRAIDGADLVVWKAEAWLGRDLNKIWLKTEGERHRGETESAELQLLYGRTVSAYWDAQIGWRGDFKPAPERNWLALGLRGTAPYFIETDIAFFIGEDSRMALRLDIEREIMLTQKLVLTPEVEINFYGKDDAAIDIGSGLSDVEAGIRLGYEIRREFAPYVGVNWERKFGGTADFARAAGEEVSDTQWVFGLRMWF